MGRKGFIILVGVLCGRGMESNTGILNVLQWKNSENMGERFDLLNMTWEWIRAGQDKGGSENDGMSEVKDESFDGE